MQIQCIWIPDAYVYGEGEIKNFCILQGFCKVCASLVFLSIFGRTDLRRSLSGGKFNEEADFDVRFSVSRANPRQISEKQDF